MIDLVYFLASVAMQDGGNPQNAFWAHPVALEADPRSVRVALAGVTGFFIMAPRDFRHFERFNPPGASKHPRFRRMSGRVSDSAT